MEATTNNLAVDSVIVLQKQRTKELFILKRLKMDPFSNEGEINACMARLNALEGKILWNLRAYKPTPKK